MSIEGFEAEINNLNQRRQEDEEWRQLVDNHRNMIEGFIGTTADLMRDINQIIGDAETEHQAAGLTERIRRRFSEMSEDVKYLERAITLISNAAYRFADRIERMRGSEQNEFEAAISDLDQKAREDEEWRRLIDSQTTMMGSFIDVSANLIRSLGQIIESIETEYQAAGLTERANRRLSEMSEDSEHVLRTMTLIPNTISGFLDRVQQMQNS